MKFKKNLILLLLLIVAAVFVLLVDRPFEDKGKKAREEAVLLFPSLQTSEVKKLSVKRSDDTTPIMLTKVDNAWYVMAQDTARVKDEDGAAALQEEGTTGAITEETTQESYAANKDAVTEVIAKLKSLKAANLASRNQDKHDLFEVTDGKGINVVAYGPDDEELANLFIGKAGPDLFSTYIRKNGSNEVYLYDKYLKGDFDRQVDTWRDRTIFDFKSEEITGLTIANKDETLTLQKNENNTWQIVLPRECPAQSTTVTRLATSLATLRAGKFADDVTLEDSGLVEPQTRITMTFEDGSTKTLLIGNKKEDNYFYAKAGDKKNIYEIYKGIVEKLTPSLQELEKEEVDQPVAGGTASSGSVESTVESADPK